MASMYVLGIDLGSTSIKVVLFDAQLKVVTDTCRLPTNSDVSHELHEHVRYLGILCKITNRPL